MTYTPDQWEQIIASGIEAAGGGGGGGGTIILETEYDADFNLADVSMTAAEIVEAVNNGHVVYLTLLVEEDNTKNYMPFAGEYLVDGELAYALFGVSGWIYVDNSKHCYEELPQDDDDV